MKGGGPGLLLIREEIPGDYLLSKEQDSQVHCAIKSCNLEEIASIIFLTLLKIQITQSGKESITYLQNLSSSNCLVG